MDIKIKEVSVSYRSIKALENVTISLKEGCISALIGPNGAGKSTLLKCINRIIRPQIGSVLIGETDVKRFSTREIAKIIGYVPQSHGNHLPLTVLEVVLMGRRPYVSWSLGKQDQKVARDALKTVGMEHFAERYFNETSGGERQKVLLARALAQEPTVLLLDEPTSNLDLKHQLEVLDLVKHLTKARGLVTIMAVHDLNLGCRFSDFMIMLNKGRIFRVGEPHEVLTRDNIREVYGVEVYLLENPKIIVPMEVVSK